MTFQVPISDKKLANEKYQRIIDAAIKVFSKQGFYNSKVADVARAADVADGTIYLYFKNKDDLLISIFEHSMDYFLQEAQKELQGETSPIEKLRKFIALHLQLVQKNPNLAVVLQVELRSSHKFMTEYEADKFFQYLRLLENIIKSGQEKGLFKSDINPQIAKRAIFGAIDEMALEWILMKHKRYGDDDAATQLFHLLYDGLKTPAKENHD